MYIANLRKLLRVRALDIAGSGADYRLVAARDAVDVTVFEDLVAEAGQLADDHPVDALALHEAARELWRGRALSDLVTEIAGLEGDALRLDEQRLHAAEQRLGLAVRYGDRDAAVVELEAMIAAEPWRELAVAHLMVGLYGQGRQADALAVGAAARARLVDELGLDPSPVLRDVEQQVLEQRLPLPGRRPTAVVDGGRRLRRRLPAMLTRFVGRTEELGRLTDAGDGSRLRTVVGTGGVGKTRLALEAAHRCPHPAVFVPLSATDPSGVVRATIAATGLPIGPAATAAEMAEVFVAELGDRPAWLVLDNAEHVLDATAHMVTELLRAVPTLTVIVTSREPLAIPGEAVLPIAPMQSRRRRARCSPIVPVVPVAASTRPTTRCASKSISCAQPLTACPWPSRWRPTACGCSSCPSSSSGWTIGTRCCARRCAANCRRAAPCRPRSTGATAFSSQPNRRCSVGWPCSRQDAQRRRPRPCATSMETTSRSTRSSISSPGSSTARSS